MNTQMNACVLRTYITLLCNALHSITLTFTFCITEHYLHILALQTCMHAYIQADIHTNTCRMMCVCVHVRVHKGGYLHLYTQRIGWLERWSKPWVKDLQFGLIPFQFPSHMVLFSIDGLRKHRNTRKWSLLHNPFAFVRILTLIIFLQEL
jgi:hypothetical protein